MDMVLAIVGVLLTMAVLCLICCCCMKLSDLKMKINIIRTANRRGLKVDLDKLDPKNCQSPQSNENCAIFVPDVGIIL